MNTRFSVAVHILTFLQTRNGEPASSELIASSVNTNPSLIRRLLSQLSREGLTRSVMGSGGGALLMRSAEAITLLDVYNAMDEDGAVLRTHPDANPKCPIGRNIGAVLEERFEAAEQALRAELARITIAAIAKQTIKRDRSRRLA
ncbi:MAG: transcriptional regulator [Methylocystaceae bacterium]|nr:MAG: transcriptional regulator [Methylocystaceae bacterium]